MEPPTEPRPRNTGLDAVRAGAALGVVMLHGAMAYSLSPFPGLAWTVQDHPSPVIDFVLWTVNSTVMPLFFLLSGFLSFSSLRQRGPREFLKQRTLRLLIPFVFGCVVILPIDLYAWLFCWALQGRIPWFKLRTLKIRPPEGDYLWGVAHLWYVEYLYLYSVLLWLAALIWQRLNRPRIGDVTVRLFPLAGLAIQAIVMRHSPRILIGFSHAWFPQWPNVIYFGIWFLIGGCFSLRPPQWSQFRQIAQLLAAAVILTLVVPGLRAYSADVAVQGISHARLPDLFAIGYTLVAGLAAPAILSGGLGTASLGSSKMSEAIRRFAEASFWIYLIHHPIVGLLQYQFSRWPGGSGGKFLLCVIGTLLLSLASYRLFVRETWLGRLLNGQWLLKPRELNRETPHTA